MVIVCARIDEAWVADERVTAANDVALEVGRVAIEDVVIFADGWAEGIIDDADFMADDDAIFEGEGATTDEDSCAVGKRIGRNRRV